MLEGQFSPGQPVQFLKDGAPAPPSAGIGVAASAVTAHASSVTHTATLPSGVVAGDLLLLFHCTTSIRTVSTPTGWTLLGAELEGSDTAKRRLTVFYKSAVGGDANPAMTINVASIGSSIIYRIDGHTGAPVISAGANGVTANPDPDSLTTGFGAVSTLWIASVACRTNPDATPPTGYSGYLEINESTAYVATASKIATAASDDPSAFTALADSWACFTVGIRAA